MNFVFLMIRRPPRSTLSSSSAASDVYKRQGINAEYGEEFEVSMARGPAKDVKKARGSAPKKPTPAKKAASGKAAKKSTPAKEKPTMAIEAIIDTRQARGHTEYCVKWVGFGPKHSTWERANQLDEYANKSQCIKAFEKAMKASSKVAKKPTPAKEKPAKKPSPAKEKPAKKATPAKEKPAKKPTPAKAEPKKKTPAKEKPAKKPTPAKAEPKKKPTPAKEAAFKPTLVPRGSRSAAAKPAEEPTPKRGRGRPRKEEAGNVALVAEFMKAESAKKAPAKKASKRSRGADDDEQAAALIASALKHFKEPSKAKKAKPAAKAKASKPTPKKEAPKKRAAASKPEPASKKAKTTAKKATPKKKPAEKKKKEDVFSVKELLNVRKAGNSREYEVKWSKGPNTWEPEANVSDDLIEEFEAMLIEKVSARTKFKTGSAVEVLNTADGFEWSWASGKITTEGKKTDHFNVEFALFVDSKGKKLKENNVARSRLRAPPKATPKDWIPEIGDKVEVAEDDCWWEATVEKGGKKNKEVRVMLRVSDEKKTFLLKDARPVLWEKLK
eukprot:TRINITY_DN19485_c0_g1_i1.p1 TRINITY_DN19485_c0_g1~~TRINITY_DN19485_c0_g1_i1.p1  ORF type:complete len:555 (-),score=180.96 TRINITY_DN19485_c0_g1_i1:309-1973(-)